MRTFLLALVVVPALFAQKKPITLDTLNQAGRGGGRGGMALWAPDGKSFVTRRAGNLEIYDPATKTSKELVSTQPIDAAAVKGAAEDEPMDWQNRRSRLGGMEWSDDGRELLYTSGGDVFVIHTDTAKWDQVTKTPEPEIDAKLSPDGQMVAFRRGWDLYTVDVAAKKETRLTRNGTPTLRNGGTDWVYPEELDLGTAFWWSPDSKSIAYLQFDMSREPLFPHADLLRVRALYEPERYPQAGEHNADHRIGSGSGRGRSHPLARTSATRAIAT